MPVRLDAATPDGWNAAGHSRALTNTDVPPAEAFAEALAATRALRAVADAPPSRTGGTSGSFSKRPATSRTAA